MLRYENATRTSVQVSPDKIIKSCGNVWTLLQLMEAGQDGLNGVLAVSVAVMGLRFAVALVLSPFPCSVGKIAKDTLKKSRVAFCVIALVR